MITRATLALAVLLMSSGVPTARATSAELSDPAVVGVRAGDHQGFGRVVFDLPNGATVETAVEGGRVLLVFSGADAIGRASALPRNVLAASVDGLTATLSIAPGAKPRVIRMGSRLVIDIADPGKRLPDDPGTRTVQPPQTRLLPKDPATLSTSAPPRESSKLPEPTVRAVATVPPAADRPSDHPSPPTSVPIQEPGLKPDLQTGAVNSLPAVAVATPEPARPAPALAAPVTPVETAELPAPLRTASASPGIVILPADPSVGAAAFRRGESGYVVLDRRLDFPMPTGIDGATMILAPTTTMLVVPLGPDQALRMGRTQAAWTVARELAGSDPDPAPSMRIEGGADGMLFNLDSPGRVVTILDPPTGGTLLVGTSTIATPAAAQVLRQRRPGFDLISTWLGVAVEPLSDLEELRAAVRGFTLRPAATPTTATAGLPGGRRFDFPDDPTPSLQNRLNAQMSSAALAPPRARAAPRLAAAQTMLAMGLDVEAQALLQRAISEDPQAASDAQLPALAAVAAVLSGRLDQAGGLDDPRLQDSPEIMLWRGLRDRRLGHDTAAARALPNGLALARTYASAIRTQIWPDLAEAAIEAGRELSASETPPFAAAVRLERAEKVDEALQAWQALIDGPDRANSVRAMRKLVELQLASGKITPGIGADLLERAAVAWRGDDTELALRLRAAELRAAAGQWRDALDYLRATDTLFPDRRDDIRRRKTAAFQTMLSKDGAGLSPLDVILLAADYADCVPDDESGAQLAALLADKLAALDLPARAIPVLQGLVKARAPGPARAQFGVRLGAMMMDTGDAAGALTALDGSAADRLPTQLLEERGLLRARAQSALSRPDLALSALREIDSPRADDLRATLLAKAGDWPGSLAALAALEARTFPTQGPLDARMQAVIIRQAEAAQQIPDIAKLQALQAWLPRMSDAPADLLRVLVTSPVTGTAELPRARTELALARAIPKHFERKTTP